MARQLRRAVILLALFAAPALFAQPIDYDNQKGWAEQLDKAQSPIDIVTDSALSADRREATAIDFFEKRGEFKVVDNGHAVEMETSGPQAMLRGRHFKMAQVHFHAESEHTLNGQHFPLEGHFFFRAQDGRMAVIAVMYKEGASNPLAGKILSALETKKPIGSGSLASLLPRNLAYYHYLGSLTTPPLTENVEWYILQTPVSMSADQLMKFNSRYSHNNRSIQPINNRPLTRSSGAGANAG